MPGNANALGRIEVGSQPVRGEPSCGVAAAPAAELSLDRQLREALEALQLQTQRAEYAEAALTVAQGQRDALRAAFRRRIASSHLLARVATLEAEAAERRNQRFVIPGLARLMPSPLRRFLRKRMLGSKRQS